MKKFPKGYETYGTDNHRKHQCPPAADQQNKKGNGHKSCNPSFQMHFSCNKTPFLQLGSGQAHPSFLPVYPAFPAVPCEICNSNSAAYFTGVAPRESTGTGRPRSSGRWYRGESPGPSSDFTEPPFALLIIFQNSHKFILPKIGP
jgi:hypothetical protein